MTRRILFALLFASLLPAMPPALRAQTPGVIDHPGKIGVGAWPMRGERRMRGDLERLAPAWFYTWGPSMKEPIKGFVPMIWGERDTRRARHATGDIVLGFNEPDHPKQANMPVERALALWPSLAARGQRLGSPAVTKEQALGGGSWLGRFMAGAAKRGYRVDFIAVHYYADTPDIDALRTFLTRIHAAYGKPVWLTEWSLADWERQDRFTPREQADFLTAGAQMMDDLPFVERHAWFGLYEGMDGWALGSGLVGRDRSLTPVGEAFRALRQNMPACNEDCARRNE